MADQLSDTDLRKRLKEYGLAPGPITDTTRYLYVRKLDRLLSGQQTPEPSTSSQQTKSDSKNRRRSTPLQHKLESTLGGFSSEDSGSDSITDSQKQQRRRRTLPPSSLYKRPPASPLTFTPAEESRPKPNQSNGPLSYGRLTRGRLGRTPNYEADFSDGEFNNHPASDSSYVNQQPGNPVLHGLKNLPSRTFKWLSGPAKQAKDGAHTISQQNGHQFTNSEFITEEDPKLTANYSHFISWLLLISVAVLFVTVGLLYIGVKQKESNISTSVKSFSNHICKGFSVVNCVGSKEELKAALQMSHLLHDYLSEVAGRLECGEGKIRERWVHLEVVKEFLARKMAFKDESAFNNVFNDCILLVRNHPEWGINLLQVKGSEEIRALESVIASKPLLCRISKAFGQVFKQIILSFLIMLFSVGGIFVLKRYRHNQKEGEQQIYRYVERAVEILQKHHDACQGNPDQDPRLAIVHIRDIIIPLAKRCDKNQLALWEKAVKFINENESRMRVETQQLAGEDFRVWRWLPLSSPEDFKKNNKMWQGEAFEKGSNVLPFAPTPCLKIRNMFDPEVEYGEDWPTSIQDAVLDKCEGNSGIVHVQLDVLSKEGCVYIKCNSLDSAAQAYKSLHGSWFDGNLVTVKYLRLERYHERFPDSRGCTMALTPSNNKRLSLQSPSLRNPTPLENS